MPSWYQDQWRGFLCAQAKNRLERAPNDAQPARRSVPPTRYADILGQDAAVGAARDLIGLPLGCRSSTPMSSYASAPSPSATILAGPVVRQLAIRRANSPSVPVEEDYTARRW